MTKKHWQMFTILLFFYLVFFASVFGKSECSFSKTNLYEAEIGGYKTYRTPAIIVTTKGIILAFCAAQKDGFGD